VARKRRPEVRKAPLFSAYCSRKIPPAMEMGGEEAR
jgi:hypothetical protein